MPCAGTVSGTYRLAGQGLEIALPKPALKQCPQRHEYWTAGYFFDEKLFTVRLSDGAMSLIGQSSDFRFER